MNIEYYQELVNLYANCMEEIKVRERAIELILTKKMNTGFDYTNIEFLCLQFRKIFELIVLANLVSNKEEYSHKRKGFASEWHAKRIVIEIEKINPLFYPIPAKQQIDYKTKKVKGVIYIKDGFLTKDELLEGYDKCSELLHAENPFGPPKNHIAYLPMFHIWLKRTLRLLEHHLITLVDEKKMFFVLMNNKDDDGRVQVALVEISEYIKPA
jgi:hypothetical protein